MKFERIDLKCLGHVSGRENTEAVRVTKEMKVEGLREISTNNKRWCDVI